MTIGDFVRDALAREYLGETIYNWDKSATFVVHTITVEDGGVDPQWEITFRSKLCCEMDEESGKWYRENSPDGKTPTPPELYEKWRKGYMESFHMTLVENSLPEIVETPEEEEKDLGLAKCEQCGEAAWDGRICHACGMKII